MTALAFHLVEGMKPVDAWHEALRDYAYVYHVDDGRLPLARAAEIALRRVKRDETHPKTRAAIICPNCGTEMVRVRFEIEDGWIAGWLCECGDLP